MPPGVVPAGPLLPLLPPPAEASLASFIGSCCRIGRLVTAAFCSFLALIRFIGSGKLLELSRLIRPPDPDKLPVPVAILPATVTTEMNEQQFRPKPYSLKMKRIGLFVLLVLRLPRSTPEPEPEGVGDAKTLLLTGGGGDRETADAVLSVSSPGLLGVGIGAVDTIVMFGLSRMPWARRASSFWYKFSRCCCTSVFSVRTCK